MPLTKADIDRVCRVVRKELKGSGYHGEGMHGEGYHGEGMHGEGYHGEGMHGEGMHGEGHCGCPDMKGDGIKKLIKKGKKGAKKAGRTVDKKAKQAGRTVDKGAKQVSRKTKAAQKAKEVSRYAQDENKARNLAANVAEEAVVGTAGLAAGAGLTWLRGLQALPRGRMGVKAACGR